jgi:hypothetical protein
MDGYAPPSALLMAVGIPAGFFCDGTAGRVAMVRYGGVLESLTAVEYGVWISALVPQALSEVVSGSTGSGVPDVGKVIDDLIARGLLVWLRNGLPGDISVMQAHSVRLIALGVGNTPDDPLKYRFAGQGALVPVSVSGPVYLALILSDAGVSLFRACEEVASEGGQDVGEFSQAVAQLLPTILSSGIALLNVSD